MTRLLRRAHGRHAAGRRYLLYPDPLRPGTFRVVDL